MRYDHSALREMLAAEYVLGVLKGPARRRFERLMTDRPEWRDEVEAWSLRLAPLAGSVPPVTPPATLWKRIEARTVAPRAAERSRALSWWRGLAAVSSVTAIVLAILLLAVPYAPTPTSEVSVLQDGEARAGWVLAVTRTAEGIRVRATAQAARPVPDRAYELWVLPAGAAPVSLGLLPAAGEATLLVHARAAALLEKGAALAVSIEPPGGSPTGQPTGPVAYQGKLAAL